MNEVIKTERWRWVMILVAPGAIAWAALLVRNAWPELHANLPRLRLAWLTLPLIGTVLANYVGFEVFRMLFLHTRRNEQGSFPFASYRRLSLAHLYFVGQLMKHLPGRFWGVAYQSAAGRQVGLADWLGVTITNMALASWFALWMAVTVICFRITPLLGVATIVAAVGMYWFGWNARLLRELFGLLYRIPGSAFAKIGNSLQSFAECAPRLKLEILFLFVMLSVVYLVSWAGYGLAWPGLSADDGMNLCALYTVAWLVGFFTFITPSGIGVRELVFVLMAHSYPPDVVAGMAILGRIMLLIADILLGLAFSGFSPRNLVSDNDSSHALSRRS